MLPPLPGTRHNLAEETRYLGGQAHFKYPLNQTSLEKNTSPSLILGDSVSASVIGQLVIYWWLTTPAIALSYAKEHNQNSLWFPQTKRGFFECCPGLDLALSRDTTSCTWHLWPVLGSEVSPGSQLLCGWFTPCLYQCHLHTGGSSLLHSV